MMPDGMPTDILHGLKLADDLAPSFKRTDQGNAERLVRRHGEDIFYVESRGRFLVYGEGRWCADDTGEVVRRAKEAVKAMYHEADPGGGRPIDRELAKHAMKSESASSIRGMISLAKSEPGIAARNSNFDRDPWLLNVENGTLDLRTGYLREHSREDRITKMAGSRYDPEADAPTWRAFVARVLPSEALRRFVQKLCGYFLTGDVSEQVLPFLHGIGANGKSTLVNTVLAVLGEYGQQAAPELLMAKRGAHPTELADLFGARFVASVEVEDGRRMAESLVKQLTGGERVRARYMHRDFFEFEPTHKVVLVANHRPEVRGTDHAIWRRIKMIPFEVTIPDTERDERLPEKLRDELPGILAWMVEGCLLWQREGLGEPEEVRAATAGYQADMDVLAGFLEERCAVRLEARVGASPLWKEWKEWCEENGEKPGTQTKFGMRLKERGFVKKKSGTVTWFGVGMRSKYPDNDGPDSSGKKHPEAESPIDTANSADPEEPPDSYSPPNNKSQGKSFHKADKAQNHPQLSNYPQPSGDTGEAKAPVESSAHPRGWAHHPVGCPCEDCTSRFNGFRTRGDGTPDPEASDDWMEV